jgi:hypothetical protein
VVKDSCLQRGRLSKKLGAELIQDLRSSPGDLQFSAPAAGIPRGSEN